MIQKNASYPVLQICFTIKLSIYSNLWRELNKTLWKDGQVYVKRLVIRKLLTQVRMLDSRDCKFALLAAISRATWLQISILRLLIRFKILHALEQKGEQYRK